MEFLNHQGMTKFDKKKPVCIEYEVFTRYFISWVTRTNIIDSVPKILFLTHLVIRWWDFAGWKSACKENMKYMMRVTLCKHFIKIENLTHVLLLVCVRFRNELFLVPGFFVHMVWKQIVPPVSSAITTTLLTSALRAHFTAGSILHITALVPSLIRNFYESFFKLRLLVIFVIKS